MNSKIFFLLSFTLLYSGTGHAPQADLSESIQKLDEVFTPWDSSETPGCAVGVMRDGDLLVQKAYGMADLEHYVPNTPSTIFEAGSVSKQFVTASVILLALEDKLSLEDDIREYLPELPDYGETITIRHLMNHTSGLRDWGSVVAISGWGRSQGLSRAIPKTAIVGGSAL